MASEDRFAELWTDNLEGDLDTAGQAELQALLEGDAALRQQAIDLLQTHRLLGFAHQDRVEVGEAFVRSTVADLPRSDGEFVHSVMNHIPSPVSARRFPMKMLAALACGLLVGVLATSAAWVYAKSRSSDLTGLGVVLMDEGFESDLVPAGTGMPTQAGGWAGDYCELVGEHQQVRPASGRQMLRFLRADYENKPNAKGSYVSDIYYLFDIRPYRAKFEDGGGVVQLSAGFNAATFPEYEKYQCSISLYALDAEMATNGSMRSDNALQTDSLAYARANRLFLDRRPETWQRLAGELRLPPNSDFLLVRIGLSHATAAQRHLDFPGHYLDDVRMVLTRRSPLP